MVWIVDKPDFSQYKGRWIALIQDRIVGQGGTPEQAMLAAKASRPKEIPQVIFVPKEHPFEFAPILDQIRVMVPGDTKVYLVGGAIRDALLSRPIQDYDFVVMGDALRLARKIADQLGGAYFILDEERETGRVILPEPDNGNIVMDFASCRGTSIEEDLKDRDFSINSMAVDLEDVQALLDPLGGASDLWHKSIRACSHSAFTRDPLRILRAIRIAASFGMRIQPETRNLMRDSVHQLVGVSNERIRDELFKMLGGPKSHSAIRALSLIGALQYVLPELGTLKGVTQSSPHIKDVWEHTLDTLKNMDLLLETLIEKRKPDDALGLILGLWVIQFGKYQHQIKHHLDQELITGRKLRALLFLAGLYHDIGKPESRLVDADDRIRYFGHEQSGAEIVSQRAVELKLGRKEIDHLKIIVQHHLRPTQLARHEHAPSSKAIYRYFRDTGDIGIDIGLLSLADILATYGNTLPQGRWSRQLEVVRFLFDSWWEKSPDKVNPPLILNGHDLMNNFNMRSGPEIGILLERVREAQAIGEVETREDALRYVKILLNAGMNKKRRGI